MDRYCAPPVGVVCQAAIVRRFAVIQCLLQCIEHTSRVGGPAEPPTDDAPRVGIDRVEELLRPARDLERARHRDRPERLHHPERSLSRPQERPPRPARSPRRTLARPAQGSAPLRLQQLLRSIRQSSFSLQKHKSPHEAGYIAAGVGVCHITCRHKGRRGNLSIRWPAGRGPARPWRRRSGWSRRHWRSGTGQRRGRRPERRPNARRWRP